MNVYLLLIAYGPCLFSCVSWLSTKVSWRDYQEEEQPWHLQYRRHAYETRWLRVHAVKWGATQELSCLMARAKTLTCGMNVFSTFSWVRLFLTWWWEMNNLFVTGSSSEMIQPVENKFGSSFKYNVHMLTIVFCKGIFICTTYRKSFNRRARSSD